MLPAPEVHNALSTDVDAQLRTVFHAPLDRLGEESSYGFIVLKIIINIFFKKECHN